MVSFDLQINSELVIKFQSELVLFCSTPNIMENNSQEQEDIFNK